MATGAGIERVLQRIRSQIEDGSYYEAQQSYKTLYCRYKARDLARESYRVLVEGGIALLEKRQVNCGVELGSLLLQAYEEDQVELEGENIVPFRAMVCLLPNSVTYPALHPRSAEVEEGYRFLDKIIKLLKKRDVGSDSYREFNSFAGDYLLDWEGGSALGRLTIYYSRGRNWRQLTKVLLDCMELADPSEEDLFMCRAVLQVLQYSEHEPVASAASFLKYHGDQKGLPVTPLMNFTSFLLEALQIPSESLVDMLRAKYKPALSRDKHMEHLLDNVKGKLFSSRPNSLFSNLLDELMGSSSSAS